MGWTLEQARGLTMKDMHEYIQYRDGLNTARNSLFVKGRK